MANIGTNGKIEVNISSLADIERSINEIEIKFPRATTPMYFRANDFTFRLICSSIVAKVRQPSITTYMASEFLGMACIYDEAKPNGVIEFLNADKEIIERICIFGDQNDPQLSDSKS